MNYVSYVTFFGNVFRIFIRNINRQARNDRNSVGPLYIVIEIIKNVLRQKKHHNYSMWQCVITSIIHTNTEYVTFNSDNVFVPGEV